MRKEDCFYLGKIAKKFSFKGELLIYLDTDEPELYENMESVFVDLHNSLVPFFIQHMQHHKGDLYRVRFEDVLNEADADALLGKDIYLPLSFLPKLEGKKFYFHEIVGFEAHDNRLGPFGTVLGVNDSGLQPLFEIDNNGKRILIPMVDDFIVQIDRQNRILQFNTPEGLIDFYLES